MDYTLFGKTLSGPFTIPSGIITTTMDSIRLYAETVPEVGILTTKSISRRAKEGNPSPILEQVTEWEFRNAVGLANPGVESFVEELKGWEIPPDKFLLASIFGENTREFVEVAEMISPYADGLEINVSCPHADKGGALFGSDPVMTAEVVTAVRAAVSIPVITKLTPNVEDIGKIADAALSAGSDGLTLINTWGPHESKILSKGRGGTSGRRVFSLLKENLRKVAPVVDRYENRRKSQVPVIAMGGIYCAADIAELKDIGPQHPENLFFGIGTALFDKTHKQQQDFLRSLYWKFDLNSITGRMDYSVEKAKARKRLMGYKEMKIEEIVKVSDGLRVFYFNNNLLAYPGQFVMGWIPGVSENPFTVADSIPLALAAKKHTGKDKKTFTEALWELKRGETLKIRGPYGSSFPVNRYGAGTHVLLAGGVGAATLLPLARELGAEGGQVIVMLGARSRKELLFAGRGKYRQGFEDYGAKLMTITDDEGFATVLLERFLAENKSKFNLYTCGPEVMMHKALRMASQDPNFGQGYAAVERYMKCGVGVCNSCAMDGKSTCKDGPVRSWEVLKDSSDFGSYKRDKCGARVKI